MISIVTPVSSLFVDEHNAQIIDKHSDFLECRDHSPVSDYSRHILFHTDLQPAHILTEEDFEYIEKIKTERPQLKLMSFHLASCYHDPVIDNGLFVPGTKRYSREELLNNAKCNIARIKKILGPKIAVAIENNNHYDTPAYNYVTNHTFITSIENENGINLLYNIPSVLLTQYGQHVGLFIFVTFANIVIKSLLQISQKNINFKFEKVKIFLGFIIFFSEKNLDL